MKTSQIQRTCEQCGHMNPISRIACENCGLDQRSPDQRPLPALVSRKNVGKQMLFIGGLLCFLSFSSTFIQHAPRFWFDDLMAGIGVVLIIGSWIIDPIWKRRK
jgi:hypothetical protein